MKKALIHDWYYVSGGAEKVIKSINNIYTDFDHYALVDFLDKEDRDEILNGSKVNTSFIQTLPTAKSNHRKFLQFFPFAIEQFDLSHHDLIISSSAAVSKGVLTTHNQLHICYCHSPMRYAWDLYHQYLREENFGYFKNIYAKYILHKIRLWDRLNSDRVDEFVANSHYVRKRIKKVYRREATVIYPPVDVDKFELCELKDNYYFTASRMVPYKKIKLIVEAFNLMPDKKLIVAGDGPNFKEIKACAKSNISLLGFIENSELKRHLSKAKAFVYAAEEDFGIIPVEAQACGTPVIGYNKGGLTETVIHEKTGVLFNNQNTDSIKNAVQYFEVLKLDPKEIRENSERFSRTRFEDEFETFVNNKYEEFKK
jgi:glycosyltransferase involved in cell wall biosynthesis